MGQRNARDDLAPTCSAALRSNTQLPHTDTQGHQMPPNATKCHQGGCGPQDQKTKISRQIISRKDQWSTGTLRFVVFCAVELAGPTRADFWPPTAHCSTRHIRRPRTLLGGCELIFHTRNVIPRKFARLRGVSCAPAAYDKAATGSLCSPQIPEACPQASVPQEKARQKSLHDNPAFAIVCPPSPLHIFSHSPRRSPLVHV